MMASYKYIWQAVLTVYMTFCIPAMTSDEQYDLSVSVTTSNTQRADYNFNDLTFNRFYHCLRNTKSIVCDAAAENNGAVYLIRGILDYQQMFNKFTCKPFSRGFACKRGDSPPDISDFQNYITYSIDRNAPLSQHLQLSWVGVENVEMNSDKSDIIITKSENKIFKIQATFGTSLPTTTPKPIFHNTDFTRDSATSTPTTAGRADRDKLKSDDGDDNNNLAIIIGAAAGGVVVIVIIVIIFWRCKKRSSSSTTNNKDYEDTDIYPYGDSSLSNIEPNLNSNSLNTSPNPKELTPDMYAAVEPNKKPNKIKSSSGTKNADENNKNKSQQKKPQFNQSLDYTEVDIDNDADHYQSSSDVHDGQGVANRVTISPSAPPYPSAKPSYYSISSETGTDPKAMYTQVKKTNKTEEARAINGDGTGSNPTHDPSGYEEAVLRIDTQYRTVEPSANNTPKPAPDGVYAKLHDPLRNITDVYNEWPATDNAGE